MTEPLEPTELAWRDPALVYAALRSESRHAFWLDAGPDAVAGWSWAGTGRPESDAEVVRAVVCASTDAPYDDVAGPFRGGWVGWMDYEDAARRAGAPVAASDTAVPSALWLRVERFAAFDHANLRLWWFAPTGDVLPDAPTLAASAAEPAARTVARARHEPGEYADLVEACRAAIREGDAYQLCLTTRFDVEGVVEPSDAYGRLRAATPAHHGGLIVAPGVSLLSASPEQFLEVRRGVVRTKPIKGTRPRGRDAEEDTALAAELAASPKERAENVMIVDLMRNDLSRVSRAGSVVVDELLAVESYAAVHQLVSTVSGELATGTRVGELLDATFPAGSMTGAPKLSAMTILHRLEREPRGIFSGAFGWVGDDGSLDLAMVIRSIVVNSAGAYVGAGGGITWHSKAAEEVAEVGVKARGPLAAIGAELPSGW